MNYKIKTVTRIQEGASWEDIENGDAYETAYIVYDEYGEIIWDTTNYENVKPYVEITEQEKRKNITEELKMEKRTWYAVVRDEYDQDWGYGSFEYDDAYDMALELAKENDGEAMIVYIEDGDDPVCIDTEIVKTEEDED